MTTTVLHASDVHFGAEDKDALRAFEDGIAEYEPDLIVFSGDLTQRGRRVEFQQAAEWIKSLPCPTVAVPGNHDTPMFHLGHRVARPFERFRQYFLHTPMHGQANDFHLFGLNTARGWQVRRNWAEGSVRLSELELLIRRSTAAAAEGGLSALFCHHPLLPPPSAPMRIRTRRGRRATDMVRNSPIDLVLAGHVHVPTAHWQGDEAMGFLAVTAGTLSERIRRHPPSYNVIQVNPDAFNVETVAIDGGKTKRRGLGAWRRRKPARGAASA